MYTHVFKCGQCQRRKSGAVPHAFPTRTNLRSQCLTSPTLHFSHALHHMRNPSICTPTIFIRNGGFYMLLNATSTHRQPLHTQPSTPFTNYPLPICTPIIYLPAGGYPPVFSPSFSCCYCRSSSPSSRSGIWFRVNKQHQLEQRALVLELLRHKYCRIWCSRFSSNWRIDL